MKTYKSLRKFGYTGDIVVVVDDEDGQVEEYKRRFGEENVRVFNKRHYIERADNIKRGGTGVVLYARNACYDIARDMGKEWFIELDDDYYEFSYRFDWNIEYRNHDFKDMDFVLRAMVEFMERDARVKTVTMAQGGDYIGGGKSSFVKKIFLKRKAMNSFVCNVDRRIDFIGRINEDVNTYALGGTRGELFFMTNQIALNQYDTQGKPGGMTGIYAQEGTYVKSFFTLIVAPSCVKISEIGTREKRIHHKIYWRNCTPKILRQGWKKEI